MKKNAVLSALRFGLVTLWRLALILAAAAAVACAGIYMTLEAVLCGPSQTARDQLTLTLLEQDSTRFLPEKFLDEATVDAIRAVEYTFSSAVSDPALISSPAKSASTVETLDFEHFTAQVTLSPAETDLHLSAGAYYAHLNADGKLILATGQDEADALGISGRCGHILILNGQANEALFAKTSGFAPRTAIGQLADGTLILVTTDGLTPEHPGATWQDMINILTHYGAVNACIME